MYIDIVSTKYDTYDCYQNNIIAVLGNYFKIDYRPFFWSGFDFRFSINQKKKYINITGYNAYQEQILSEQCGVKINCINKTCIQKFKQIILKELNNSKPIGLRLNGSDLSWNNDKMNIDYHYLLIIGIDVSDSLLYCRDSFLSNKIQTIDISCLYEKVEYILIYSISEEGQISFDMSRDNFFKCLDYNSKNKNSDLYHFINNASILFENIKGTNPNNNSVIFQLSRVCWSRYNFMKSLEYFHDIYGNERLDNIKIYFNIIIDTWTKLKNIFIRAALISNVQQLNKYSENFIKTIIETESVIQNYLEMQN